MRDGSVCKLPAAAQIAAPGYSAGSVSRGTQTQGRTRWALPSKEAKVGARRPECKAFL